MSASAQGLHDVVLGDFLFRERQIKDLARLYDICKRQFILTRWAVVWYVVDNDFAGLATWRNVRPTWPFCPPVGF
jgi:hypothetical protein